MATALALGLLFGFLGSVPIAGPLAAVAMKLALDRRYALARMVALGAALGEGGYALAAYFGVTGLVGVATGLSTVAHLVAAAVLVGLGVHFLRAGAPAEEATTELDAGGGAGGLLLGLTLTATNPTLLLTWSGAIAFVRGAGLVDLQPSQAGSFALGAALGVVAWFWLLLAIAERYRDRLLTETLDQLVRATGVLLIALGLGIAARAALGTG